MGNRQKAIEFFNQAVVAVNDKQNPLHLQTAYTLFAAAAIQDSTWYQSWYQLGNNNNDLGKPEAAIADWQLALNCDMPDSERAKVLGNMTFAYINLGKFQDAWDCNIAAEKLDANSAHVAMNWATLYGNRGDKSKAVKWARRAVELDPDSAELQLVLAFTLLFNECYQEGFEVYEWRFLARLKHYLLFPYPKWDGKTDNVNLLLASDQGLGDTLSFARFVPAVAKKCKHVYMNVHAPLLRAFSHMFTRLGNVTVLPMHGVNTFPDADVWTTFVSLPYVLHLTDQQIRDQQFEIPLPANYPGNSWKRHDKKFHIGFAWSGSKANLIQKHRNIPLEKFFRLYEVPGIALYSLQADEAAEQLMQSGASGLVTDMRPYIGDVCDTAGIVEELDLVITVESALGHICGSMGKECWVPYSYLGRDYRAGYTGRTKLWYPNHTFFQQSSRCDWDEVFTTIIEALKKKVAEK